ncbi:MAG: tetratricopeptide repeat protein [Endomicrobium sp.]|jgi:TolA-binding protein|nr:tetratricopeptide repeat protein [Endomicrobium sp.]
MKQYILKLLFFIIFFNNIGWTIVILNSKKFSSLNDKVSKLDMQHKYFNQNYDELCEKVTSSLEILDGFNTSIQDLKTQVSLLNQSVYDLKEVFNNEILKKCNDQYFTTPSQLYQIAYADYLIGKYELAYSEFQYFISKYYDSEIAPQAIFYMGECLYCCGIWDKAIEEYKKIEKDYETSDLVPSARLKMALCYDMLSNNAEAFNIFSSIIKDFPERSESLMAKEKIKMYKNVKTK